MQLHIIFEKQFIPVTIYTSVCVYFSWFICYASNKRHGIIGIVTRLGFRNPGSQWTTHWLFLCTIFISPKI